MFRKCIRFITGFVSCQRKEKKMKSRFKKIYILTSVIYIIVSFVLTFCISYSMGVIAHNQSVKILKDRLEKTDKNITLFEKEKNQYIDQITDDSEAKAEALAVMIMQNPSMLKDAESLEDVRLALELIDINITDKDGVVIAGTSAFTGGAFEECDYIPDFMPAVSDKQFVKTFIENRNGTEYIFTGVSRLDKGGIIQIISSPMYYDTITGSWDIKKAVNNSNIENNECIGIIDKKTYKYVSHTDSVYLLRGEQFEKSLFDDDEGSFETVFEGENALLRYKQNEKYIIISMRTDKIIYKERNIISAVLISVLTVMLFVTLLLVRQALIMSSTKNSDEIPKTLKENENEQ